MESRSTVNTAIGSTAAFFIGVFLFRRVLTFPGVGILSYVLPAVAASYGVLLASFFVLRLEYSRLNFTISFVLAAIFFFWIGAYLRRHRGQRFYLVPSESTQLISLINGVDWVYLKNPQLPQDRSPVLIADLRADLGADWERMIADAAVSGCPVYHVKQVSESLTGRVEIEHLSENSFGSLLPNLSYRKLKRLGDITTSVLLLPFLLLPGFLVALLIKLDSSGPVFFKQRRRGYRGEVFEVIKFRTMIHRKPLNDHAFEREESITRTKDVRVTRVGRFLRRSRIDELPQILNIIRGEMSWIGPRPEALSLSEWYMSELPFYTYRHIVRPGITGWAQVNQGHVADLGEVLEKLHYDFYYIKNFSAWLDLLILGRTIAIVLSGHGAK